MTARYFDESKKIRRVGIYVSQARWYANPRSIDIYVYPSPDANGHCQKVTINRSDLLKYLEMTK
jgi:hypothetical protein